MNIISKHKKNDKPFFPNLYGLRFIAASAVLLFHAVSLFRESWDGIYQGKAYSLLLKLAGKGSLGVNLFFVLSGFLITYLLLWEIKKNDRVNVLAFLKRRSLRIWPLYFLLVLFCFYIFPHLAFSKNIVYDIRYYLAFLSNFEEIKVGLQDGLNFLTPFWSVAVEEQFYISLALIILIFKLKKARSFYLLYILVILVSIGFRLYNIGNDRVIYYHSFSVMSDIAIGGIVAILCFNGRLIPWLKSLSKQKIIALYLIIFLIILLKNQLFVAYMASIERLVLGLGFAFIIVEQIYADNSFFAADKWKLFRMGGEISYGLYLIHAIVMYFVSNLMVEFFEARGWIHFSFHLIISFGISFLLAFFSYNYYERKFLKYK